MTSEPVRWVLDLSPTKHRVVGDTVEVWFDDEGARAEFGCRAMEYPARPFLPPSRDGDFPARKHPLNDR